MHTTFPISLSVKTPKAPTQISISKVQSIAISEEALRSLARLGIRKTEEYCIEFNMNLKYLQLMHYEAALEAYLQRIFLVRIFFAILTHNSVLKPCYC